LSELLKKLKKNSIIDETSILENSTFFDKSNNVHVPLNIPILNVALSGDIKGGFEAGVTIWAGPSKHFKTALCLNMAKAFFNKYEDAALIFLDNEFGSPPSYFKSFDLDPSRILHVPFASVEQLKHEVAAQLSGITRGDRVMFIVDSLGNVGSAKEIQDAEEQKSVADMTRAKQIKSFFRIITPKIKMKDIPFIAVNHTYKEQSNHPRDIMSGGTGPYYSADNIIFVGRRQDKDSKKELVGYDFVINVEKSRFVKEKAMLPTELILHIGKSGGINKWSGLLDLALESGHVENPSKGWYCKKGSDKKMRRSETNTSDFWKEIIDDVSFQQWIKDNYALSGKIIGDEDV
jgi:hypothetical protein